MTVLPTAAGLYIAGHLLNFFRLANQFRLFKYLCADSSIGPKNEIF
jgi:hypothetical protein